MTDNNGEIFDRRALPKELSDVLREHSPQLVIKGPALIRVAESPTGWIVVIPHGDAADQADVAQR